MLPQLKHTKCKPSNSKLMQRPPLLSTTIIVFQRLEER
jgi:hypothetical protein